MHSRFWRFNMEKRMYATISGTILDTDFMSKYFRCADSNKIHCPKLYPLLITLNMWLVGIPELERCGLPFYFYGTPIAQMICLMRTSCSCSLHIPWALCSAWKRMISSLIPQILKIRESRVLKFPFYLASPQKVCPNRGSFRMGGGGSSLADLFLLSSLQKRNSSVKALGSHWAERREP